MPADSIEVIFTNLISDIIKPVSLVIGNKSISIAHKLSDNLARENSEITGVTKTGYKIEFTFKPKIKDSEKLRILINYYHRLRDDYFKELGAVADKMIDFAMKEYSMKIPAIIRK